MFVASMSVCRIAELRCYCPQGPTTLTNAVAQIALVGVAQHCHIRLCDARHDEVQAGQRCVGILQSIVTSLSQSVLTVDI